MEELKFIFVHGLSGWGSYDKAYQRMPYWGMRNGDLIKQLQKEGFDCYAASVGPQSSAHDRACELYAQLSGTRTDYGKVHAQRYGHGRFGPDFTGRALIEDFEHSKIVLLGHSFGGTTIRLFSHILENGLEEERGEDCSAFFQGGKKSVVALISLADSFKQKTAYEMYDDPSFDPEAIQGTRMENGMASLMNKADTPKDPLPVQDCAAYDMHIDNALKLNESIKLSKDIFYFSQPCCITKEDENGYQVPDKKRTEILYARTARRMGAYTGKTKDGFVIDESWRASDGLVNTVSQAAPLSDPSKKYEENDVPKGIWNVFETYDGDHMSLQGGMLVKNRIFPYYRDLLGKIVALSREKGEK